MAGPISPHYILSTLPIGIIIRFLGKFVLHFWAWHSHSCVHTCLNLAKYENESKYDEEGTERNRD